MPESWTLEDLAGFRHRLRGWLKENMPPADSRPAPYHQLSDAEELAQVAHHRELQRMLYDGGFAGIIFPKEYGGAGPHPGAPGGAQRGDRRLPVPGPHPGAHVQPVCRGDLRVRHRGAEARPTCRNPAGRGDLDAVPLRAGRRLGRGRGADHGRARRGRMGAQRLEDLDHRGLVGGLGAVPGPDELGRAQAPRPVRVHAPHPPARASRCTGSRCSTGRRSSARSS